MMRVWLVALALGVAGGTASARRVIHIPQLWELCPNHADWSKLAQCFTRQGKHRVVRDEPQVNLVTFAAGTRISGTYVYELRDKLWRYRGHVGLYHDEPVVRFERVSLGKRSAYRVDVAQSTPTFVSLDGETSTRGLARTQVTMLCFDQLPSCVQAVTSCDVFVRGKALYTFRGTPVVRDNSFSVEGDRSRTGSHCSPGQVSMRLPPNHRERLR